MSVDVAWDSLPINKATIPLLQYAQGKISIEQCGDRLDNMGVSDQFCDYDEEGNLKKIDALRLYEVSVNLIRSYVTRRVAAQVSRFSNLFPYFKYEPRSTNIEDKLRADVLSQRVEMMTDQFGYRHQWEQIIRQMFMYGHSVAFPAEGWTRKVQWRHEKNEMTGEDDLKSYIEKEGIEFFTPHPTRMLWDTSKPLHGINNDQGPEWLGYWDIVRYGDLKDSADSWNIDEVSYTNSLTTLYDTHADFFNYYFSNEVMNFPKSDKDTFAWQNERTANVGIYSGEDEDKGMFVTNMFMKVNPLRDGLGEYPHDVWIKFVVASDETVLFAEFLPSLPAIYGGLNENDDRLANISVAHEIMPFQDQLNNIISKMLHDMKISMMKIFCIDQDALDDEVKEYIKDALSEESFYAKPKALFYSGQKAADLGINNKDFITIVDAQKELSAGINQSMQAILQLLNLVERLLILSPQELGQAAPREISATEVAEIANSTNSVYSFISEGIDDMRAAAKKMIYDHLVSCSESDFIVPIKSRYTKKSIEDAGFISQTDEPGPASRNIIGTPENLIHEYMFTSRDGAERARDTQSAQVLGNLLQSILQLEGVAQGLGKERIFEMFNEIFRLSGAHDLKLETDEYDDSAEQQKTIQDEQFFQQMKQQFPQVLKSLQELAQVVQGLAGGQKQIASAAAEGVQAQQPEQTTQQANINPEVKTKV